MPAQVFPALGRLTTSKIISILSTPAARRVLSGVAHPPHIPSRYHVRLDGTLHPRYSEKAVKRSVKTAMESSRIRRYLTRRFGALGDGVEVVAMKCVPEASPSDPRLHYTSRVFDSRTGRFLGGLHTFGRRSFSKPSFLPWWKHSTTNKWRKTMFRNVSDIREIF